MLRSIGSTATLKSQARNEDTNRGFNLITLRRKDSEVTAVETKSFSWLASGLQLATHRVFEYRGGNLSETT
ncbi:MAG: hypothetical protein ACI86S_001614 [Paracoccaceae bacterium]|jgi:hypothetical protein